MVVVADTGPINYLVRIGEIELLPALFGRIIIPVSVQFELLDAGAPASVRWWMANPPAWLDVRTPSLAPDPALVAADLDRGEQDAILLALELASDQIIMDEMDGRREAKRRQINVTGTLGVLRTAATFGLVDLEEVLNRLLRTNFHVSRKLIDQIIAESNK